MTIETEQLLPEKQTHHDEWDEAIETAERYIPWPKQSSYRAWLAYLAIIHILFFISVIYDATNHFGTLRTMNPNTYTPASDIVRFYDSDVHPSDRGHHSIYSGEPTKESVKAWDDLVDPSFFAVTEEELVRSGASPDEAVRLAHHEGQFLGGLGAFHDLHCLRQLRFWVYQDHYYVNLTEKDRDHVIPHLAHCIETLRVTIMCSADMSFYTFRWEDPNEIRPNPKSHNTRQCLEWEPLDRWSRERSVGYYPWLLRPSGEAESVHMI